MFEVIENQILAPSVHRMVVKAPRVAAARKPGQFVIVRCSEGAERIPLTIADENAQNGTITLVIQAVGADTFPRVRIGIGHGQTVSLVQHVLTPFSGEEKKTAERQVHRASEAVLCLMKRGVEAAMNEFNGAADGKGNSKKMEDGLEKI